MPILNNLTVNEIGGSGPLPAWYRKQYVDSDTGELKYDKTQTTFSTNPATEINVSNMFENLFNTGLLGEADGAWITTVDCSDLVSTGADYVFAATFVGQDTITSVDFSNLETVSDDAFSNTFSATPYNDNYPTTFSFPSLTTIGFGSFGYCWSYNENITTALFPLVETIAAEGFAYCFGGSNISVVSFPSVIEIGSSAFLNAFEQLLSATLVITFGSDAEITLGQDCFVDMFMDTNNTSITINAPAANQAEIEAMSGYPEFGAATGTVTWNWQS